jgi:hypothetical protein
MKARGVQIGGWAVLALLVAGCVERDFTITTDPPGAVVSVSSEEKGRSPVSFPFTWYGDYDIVIRADGYQTLKTHHRVNPPLYDMFPFDLLSSLAPWTYHVKDSAHFILAKPVEPTDEELLHQAEELRARNAQPPPQK